MRFKKNEKLPSTKILFNKKQRVARRLYSTHSIVRYVREVGVSPRRTSPPPPAPPRPKSSDILTVGRKKSSSRWSSLDTPCCPSELCSGTSSEKSRYSSLRRLEYSHRVHVSVTCSFQKINVVENGLTSRYAVTPIDRPAYGHTDRPTDRGSESTN